MVAACQTGPFIKSNLTINYVQIICTDFGKDTLNIFAVNIFFICYVLLLIFKVLPDLLLQEEEKIIIKRSGENKAFFSLYDPALARNQNICT